MKYIVMGLGNYGSALVEYLTELGHEVIGIDVDEMNVDRLKDKMVTSYVLDVSDDTVISMLPLHTVDVVIVCIGEESFGASIRVVALLKKHKVKHIYARAIDELHKNVLEAFGVDRILMPEQDAAFMLARSMELDKDIEPFRLDNDHYVFKFKIPSKLVGYGVNDLELNRKFGMKLISLLQGQKAMNSLGFSITENHVANEFPENYELQDGDMLVCYGEYRQFIDFWKTMKT